MVINHGTVSKNMNPGQVTFTRFPTTSTVLVTLEPSLHAMLGHIDEYIKTYHRPELGKSELPYYFNERANIGLLAGGIWRGDPGNLVLEEYGAPKKSDEGEYRGRFDFWCRAQGCSIYLEAKQTWGTLSNPEQSLGQIVTHLKQEYHDAYLNAANDLASGSVHHICGAVFSVPSLSERQLSQAESILTNYHQTVNSGLSRFSDQSGLHVLRANFFWTDMLQPTAVYKGQSGNWCHPLFDVIFATMPRVS
jgi:hypothetical protein